MCGIAGQFTLRAGIGPNREVLTRMTQRLTHRGPDDEGYFVDERLGLGFRRLSLVDLEGGHQPIFNEDESLVLVCNGEIYNYRDLTCELERRGHRFRTRCDVEVLLHLYEEYGTDMFARLNGQFAFALYDRRARRLMLARDPFGISPLFYATAGGLLLFGSEIKAVLEHPGVSRAIDLIALDQVLSLPGAISPRTMFEDVRSLEGGHYLIVEDGAIDDREYWDLDYPRDGDAAYDRPDAYYLEELSARFDRAVALRLQADVPVGCYLSGGLDSSLIASRISRHSGSSARHSFSITFADASLAEARYQRMVAEHLQSIHHEILSAEHDIHARLPQVIYHCECPVKESYDACSLVLSEAARRAGVIAVLTGEGSDELFGGYVGYRFDQFGRPPSRLSGVEEALERQTRARLWGDPDLFYEHDFIHQAELKQAVYSAHVDAEAIDCTQQPLVNTERLRGRHPVHQRSYLDCKLRLSDHLVSEHGDRMALAHGVEARYPFLDADFVDFARHVPPSLKVRGLVDKYAIREIARGDVPAEIAEREKFGFLAPGSTALLRQPPAWMEELLSPERIRRDGYFNPDTVTHLAACARRAATSDDVPQSDLLLTILTFNLLLDTFHLPRFGD